MIIRYGRKEQHFHRVRSPGVDIAFGFSLECPWVHVIAIIGDDVIVTSYSFEEKRWRREEEYREEVREQHAKLLLSELGKRFSWGH